MREASATVLDATANQMIVFGGYVSSGVVTDLWRLSLGGSPAWSSITAVGNTPQFVGSAVYDSANARMILFGGLNNSFVETNAVNILSNANGASGTPTWIPVTPSGTAPAVRYLHSAIYDPSSNRMIVFGGSSQTSGAQNDVWVLTGANGLSGTPSWIKLAPTGTAPTTRWGASAVYDSVNNRMILFGGNETVVGAGSASGNDVWVLSNANGVSGTPAWSQLSPSGTAPPPREYAAAVYDAANNRMVLFGGEGSAGVFSDVWTLSNANGLSGTPAWAQDLPSGGPSARAVAGNAYNASTSQMVIFGGYNGSAYLNDAWALSLVSQAPPSLGINKSHSTNFNAGQTGTFTITVSNASGSGPTSGTVTVTDTLPAGLTLTGMSGTGWNCSGTTCTRGDALSGGANYPAITVTVNVSLTAASPLVNTASVSGGGSAAPPAARDTVTVIPVVGCNSLMFNATVGGGAVSQSCSLSNPSVTVSTSSGAPWLTAVVSNGQLVVTAAPGSVANPQAGSTYTGTVTLSSNGSTLATVAVSLTLANGVTLSSTAASVGSGGAASGSLGITSAGAWAVTSDSPWVIIDSPAEDASGNACASGNGSVTYTVAANTAPNSRTAILTVLSGCPTGGTSFAVGTYTITQAGQSNCNSTAVFPQGQQTTFVYNSAGTGSTDTTVRLNNSCSGPVSQDNWITITGSSSSSFTFSVAPNTGSAQRSGAIQVGPDTITITQNPPVCTYSVVTTPGFSATIPAAGGPGSVTVHASAGCGWTVSASSNNFIEGLSPASGGGGSTATATAVAFTVPANSQTSPLSGVITIAGQGQSLQYTVTQLGATTSGAPPTYQCSINPDPARTLRAEGEAELTADLVLICHGNSVGGVMGDVIVTFNSATSVTNHTLDAANSVTDALLLNVDSSGANWTLGQNAYRGLVAGPRSIRFPSVALAPETGAFLHTFRITNTRVDVSRLVNTGGNQSAPAITETVSIQPPLAMPSAGAPFQYSTTPQTVGTVPFVIEIFGANAHFFALPSSSFAAGSLTASGISGISYWPLTYSERQQNAFLPALAAGQSPSSTPGVQYVSESGFVNLSAFGAQTGYSGNGRWGSLNPGMGTRLLVNISNVPCGVTVYAPDAPSSGGEAALVSADATGSGGFLVVSATEPIPRFNSIGYQVLTLSPSNGAAACNGTSGGVGSAIVTWEVTAALAGSPSALIFQVYVQNPNGLDLSGVTFTGGLAPQVNVGSPSTTAPVPRFSSGSSTTPMLSFFFVPNSGASGGGARPQVAAAKMPAGSVRGRGLLPETSGGSQCSQTATATVTNEGSVAANSVATVQGAGPLSGCFGPNAQASGASCSCNTNVPPGGVYQCSATSTSCSPANYTGYTTSDQGNSDPNDSDNVQPPAPILTLSTTQSPAAFVAGDISGDDTVTVRVVNTGDDAPAGTVSVVETIPANSGLNLVSIAPPTASAGDPYSQYWACTVNSPTTGTCIYGNNPNANPPQQPLLNSSRTPAGFTQFTMTFQTAASAAGNVTDTLQLNTNIGGNQNFTTYTPAIAVQATGGLQITSPASNTLPQATVQASYTFSGFAASGGSGSYNWNATGLPAGLSMSMASGVISGIPTTAGTANVTVTVTDANNPGLTKQGSYSLTVAPASAGLAFYPVTPCRVVDTRAGNAPIMAAGSARNFALPSGSCNIPAAAQAFSLNVTAVPQSTLNYLTIWPTGQGQPLVSTLNSYNGAVVANAAIVPAGPNGSVSVFVTDATQVILDINGYFAPPGTGGSPGLAFYALPPCRVADTRTANGSLGGPSLGAGQPRSFPLAGNCGIPGTAQAYSLNMTAVPPAALQYLTTWPTGQAQPVVSTLNAYDGRVVANAAIVPAGTNGAISVYASNATNVVIDINGYFAPPGSPGALYFHAVTPCRVADTRQAAGAFGGPGISAGGTRSFTVPSANCGIPLTAQGYSLNVTAVPPAPLQYLTIWPAGSAQPFVSTLNAYNGAVVANAAIVPAGASPAGAVSLFASDATQVVLDINGYFAP